MSIIEKPGLPCDGGCISFEGVEPQWLKIEHPKYSNWIDSIRETEYTMKTFSPGHPYWVAIYRADVGVRYVQMKIAF